MLLPLHGLGSRQDLPLPFPAVIAGSVIVLVVSFAVLGWAWKEPRWQGLPGGRPLPRVSRLADTAAFRWLLSAVGLFAFGWVGLALWWGRDLVTNPVFGFVYVWVWVGLVPLSLLLGPVWRLLNPLRTLTLLMVRLGLPSHGLLPGRFPAQVGRYPAAVALLAFSWLELVQPDNNSLLVLRGWWLAWVGFVLIGAVLFGPRWVGAADPFEAYALLVARASPWQRVGGSFALVNPIRQLTTSPSPPGTWAVVTVLLGGTAYDGFSASSWWVRTTQTSNLPPMLWGSLGLAALVAVVGITFAAGVRGIGRLRDRSLDFLAASVIPIVIGYALAHYLSLLVLEGQRTLINLSDPLGVGWNVFGTAELGINQLWLETPQVTAALQLLAIVGGHLLGVLVAHELSLRVLPPSRRVWGQVPLLVVMIGYTCGGLLLLFSP